MFYFTLPFFAICLVLMIWKIPGDWKTYENDKIDTLVYLNLYLLIMDIDLIIWNN